jgi:hypothetical protein
MNFKPKCNKWNELNGLCWYVYPLISYWASLGFRHGGSGSSHKVHGHILRRTRTLLRQFEQIKLLMQSLWKLHGVFGIGHWSPINAAKPNKWMQYPSIMILKSLMGGIFPYIYNIFYILTWESKLFFCFLMLSFRA